jgi:DNA-binding response OmpR family regulator
MTIFSCHTYYRDAMLETPSTAKGVRATGTDVRDSILLFIKSEPLAHSVKKALEASGYQTTTVKTETDVFWAAKESAPSVIIIDRDLCTVTTLRQLRMRSVVPIVAVQVNAALCEDDCAKEYDQDVDLVLCNQTPREIVARVRAILRRQKYRSESSTHYSVGNVRMDLDRHEVTVNGRVVELTPKEFQILHAFLESPRRVFSRQEMLNKVWGEGYALEEHALDVHIHSLRKKIESDTNNPRMIVTVRGVGYKLRASSIKSS